MKIKYNNLYTHFIFTTGERQAVIPERNRVRTEKYITGIVNNNLSKLYAIYANPEHVHFLVSRHPSISEENLATIIADSSEIFINEHKLAGIISAGSNRPRHFPHQNPILIKFAGIFWINRIITKGQLFPMNMNSL